jgi:hypothetical protein
VSVRASLESAKKFQGLVHDGNTDRDV